MSVVAITLLYAALLGLLLLVLTFRVIGLRQRHKVGIGDGGHEDLALAIRVHGNFVEYVPIVLILMGLIEAAGGAAWGLHVLGIALVLSRLAHAQGLSGSQGTSPGRFAGALATIVILAVCAVWGILVALGIV